MDSRLVSVAFALQVRLAGATHRTRVLDPHRPGGEARSGGFQFRHLWVKFAQSVVARPQAHSQLVEVQWLTWIDTGRHALADSRPTARHSRAAQRTPLLDEVVTISKWIEQNVA